MIQTKMFSLLICSLFFKIGAGQKTDKMYTDRPGETQTPFLTTKGYWQAEVGVTKYGSNNEELLWHHPQLVIKKGIADWLALRLQVSEDAKKMDTGKHYINGLPAIELGFKVRLRDQKGVLPLISLYSQVGIPGRVRLVMHSKLLMYQQTSAYFW